MAKGPGDLVVGGSTNVGTASLTVGGVGGGHLLCLSELRLFSFVCQALLCAMCMHWSCMHPCSRLRAMHADGC